MNSIPVTLYQHRMRNVLYGTYVMLPPCTFICKSHRPILGIEVTVRPDLWNDLAEILYLKPLTKEDQVTYCKGQNTYTPIGYTRTKTRIYIGKKLVAPTRIIRKPKVSTIGVVVISDKSKQYPCVQIPL